MHSVIGLQSDTVLGAAVTEFGFASDTFTAQGTHQFCQNLLNLTEQLREQLQEITETPNCWDEPKSFLSEGIFCCQLIKTPQFPTHQQQNCRDGTQDPPSPDEFQLPISVRPTLGSSPGSQRRAGHFLAAGKVKMMGEISCDVD